MSANGFTPPDGGLKDVFRDATHVYRTAFPEKLAGLLIAVGDEPVYVAPEIAAVVASFPRETREILARHHEDNRRAGHAASAGGDRLCGTPILSMVFSDAEDMDEPETGFTRRMNDIFTFNHEMGHFIAPGGRGYERGPHYAECVADAFAALRHIQLFGSETGMFAAVTRGVAGKALAAAFPAHYTAATLRKTERLCKDGAVGIASLSLKETAALATKIADATALGDATLEKIAAAYAPVRPVLRGESAGSGADVIRDIAGIMLEHRNDADIYRAGSQFLARDDVRALARKMLERDPAFRAMAARMAQHEKETGFTLDGGAAHEKQAARKPPAAPGGGRP